MSITATVWPRFSRLRARVDPTRPQPMITMCTEPSLMNLVEKPPDAVSTLGQESLLIAAAVPVLW